MTEVAIWVIWLLVVISPIPHAAALLILHRASRSGSRITALEERRGVAQVMLFSSVVINLLVINFLLGRPVALMPPWSTLMTGVALLILAVPSAYFVYLYLTNRFGDD